MEQANPRFTILTILIVSLITITTTFTRLLTIAKKMTEPTLPLNLLDEIGGSRERGKHVKNYREALQNL